MLGAIGGVTAGDFDKALSLLAACGDPRGFSEQLNQGKALLAELTRLRSDTAAAVSQFATDKAAFDASQSERVAALDARERDIERENEKLAKRKTLRAREDAALTMSRAKLDGDRKEFEAGIAAARERHEARDAAADKRAKELHDYGNTLQADMAKLADGQAKLAEGEAAYKAKLADLNAKLKDLRA